MSVLIVGCIAMASWLISTYRLFILINTYFCSAQASVRDNVHFWLQAIPDQMEPVQCLPPYFPEDDDEDDDDDTCSISSDSTGYIVDCEGKGEPSIDGETVAVDAQGDIQMQQTVEPKEVIDLTGMDDEEDMRANVGASRSRAGEKKELFNPTGQEIIDLTGDDGPIVLSDSDEDA